MIEESDAAGYKTDHGWTFPFTLIDPTQGGKSLGRILWQVEPIFETIEDGTTEMTSLLVGANQTRDECYRGKLFRLPAATPRLMTYDSVGGSRNFFAGVWSITKCAEHGAVVFWCHPPNGVSKLLLDDLHSSIASTIWFE